MREGLRSGKLGVKTQDSLVSVKRPVDEEKKIENEDDHVVSGSGCEKVLNLVLPDEESSGLQVEKKSGELEEGFEGGTEEKGSVNDKSADNLRKRKSGDGDEEQIRNLHGHVGIKKAKKEESSDDKVQVFRRVLRLSSARTGGCVKTDGYDGSGGMSGGGDESEQKQPVEKDDKSDHLVGGVTVELKRKRGRPPLVKSGESDRKSEKVAVRLWRPLKVVKEESDLSELDGGLRKKKKDGRGRPPKVVKEECDLSELDGGLRRRKKKDGRGRPRKVVKEECEISELVGGLRKKKDGRGRPRKVPETDGAVKPKWGKPQKTLESNEALKVKKRGRPPKMQQSIGALRLKLGRACKVVKKEPKSLVSNGRSKSKLKLKHGRPPMVVQESTEFLKEDIDNKGDASQKDEMVLKSQDKNEADLETRDNVSSLGKLSKIVDALRLTNKKGSSRKSKVSEKGEVEPGKREVQQSVRDKIVEILLSAGWTIQLRPRLNKVYLDSVYVSLSGRTHWSVTLAYKQLKQHYENGTGESTYYKTGFKFIPLPENEIEVLKKVMIKKRVGKKKLNGMEDESENTVRVDKKKRKKKLDGKSKRGKSKGKSLFREQENSACIQRKGRPISDGDRAQKKMQNDKRRTLLVRKTMEEADSDEGGYIPYAGKRTVLAWMIDSGTVSFDSKVRYMNQSNTSVLLEGRITRDGIHCDCCNQTLTVAEFEIHSGSELCEPFKNIRLESGTSLLQCMLDSWNMQPEFERQGFHHIDVNGNDPNDDTCGICGDGGDLICCDGCPSTFHQTCLDIQKFPSGDWHCVYCSCKFCKMVGGNECQEHDNVNLAASKLLTCLMCEEKYHQFCSSVKVSGDDYFNCPSFCGKKCEELFENVKKLLGIKHDLEEGFSWTLIHRSDVGSSYSVSDESQKCDTAKQIECNSKLAVALLVMDECFLPMVDHRSGINLIRNIVYNFGSNFNRLNYGGFLTVILQRGDEIVSAASIRIHGYQLAEMPFIGTRYIYRRQGMCRRLLSAIESILCSLGVERLVIPAISELKETWTSVFGFMPLEVSSREIMKNMNLLVFPGVQMLQKPALKHQIAEENLILGEGPISSKLEENCGEAMICNAENTCAKESVSNVSGEAVEAFGDELNVPSVDPNSPLPDGSSNNADRKCLVDLNMARHNLGGDAETIMNSSSLICGSQKQHEDIIDRQNASFGSTITVTDPTTIALGFQPNQIVVSEEKSEYSVLPCADREATECGGLALCADGDAKAKDFIVTGQFSFNAEDHPSSEFDNTEASKKAVSDELEISVKKIVCRDPVAQRTASNGNCFSHHLQEKRFEAHEMQSDCATTVQTSLTLGGIYSTLENYLKASPDVAHPKSGEKPEDGSGHLRTPFPVDCSFTPSQDNRGGTRDATVSAPVDSNGDPSGAYLERNGHCKSKKVMSGSLGVVVKTLQD